MISPKTFMDAVVSAMLELEDYGDLRAFITVIIALGFKSVMEANNE